MRRLLAGEAGLLAKYERSLLESYVEDNAMTRWCPRCAATGLPRVRVHALPHGICDQPGLPCPASQCGSCCMAGTTSLRSAGTEVCEDLLS